VKIGVLSFFYNIAECQEQPGFHGVRRNTPQMSDTEIFAGDLHLARLVEPLGFDAFWTVEHHFGPYAMTANPLQILSYIAAQTEKIELGTMVLVLPWHEPLRLAEQISLLANLAPNRKLTLGVGRGAAAREFDRFRVPYSEARDRMEEVLEVMRLGLTTEDFTFIGRHYQITEPTTIRPRPPCDLTKNLLGAWSSTATADWCASEGLGQLYSNFPSLASVGESSRRFNAIRAEKGWEPVKPILAIPVYCGDDGKAAAEEAALFNHCAIWHYDLLGTAFRGKMDAFPDTPEGREQRDAFIQQLPRSLATDGGGIYGTPDEVLNHLRVLNEITDCGQVVLSFRHGHMTHEDAEASMRLFADRVLPAFQEDKGGDGPIATPYSQVVQSREIVQMPA
jgi:alkanesulfonate monooxygenase SsuD/methylene tetrahydromethanopterin reductase-like flavin-dependent oxidoreductase (luciferase family)